jgi:hypothetical protein
MKILHLDDATSAKVVSGQVGPDVDLGVDVRVQSLGLGKQKQRDKRESSLETRALVQVTCG